MLEKSQFVDLTMYAICALSLSEVQCLFQVPTPQYITPVITKYNRNYVSQYSTVQNIVEGLGSIEVV